MKTVYGFILIVSFACLLFVGVSNINNQALINNDRLDTDSINVISTYDDRIENISTYQNLDRPDTTVGSANTSQVDAFFREYAEAKDNIDKLTDGVNYIFDLPEIVLIAIPFIDNTDQELVIYKSVFWLFATFLVIIIIYKAVRGSKVDNE